MFMICYDPFWEPHQPRPTSAFWDGMHGFGRVHSCSNSGCRRDLQLRRVTVFELQSLGFLWSHLLCALARRLYIVAERGKHRFREKQWTNNIQSWWSLSIQRVPKSWFPILFNWSLCQCKKTCQSQLLECWHLSSISRVFSCNQYRLKHFERYLHEHTGDRPGNHSGCKTRWKHKHINML